MPSYPLEPQTEKVLYPAGLPTNDGSKGSPWDWNSTCGQNPPHRPQEAVKPGDTVWVHGGSYG